MDCKKAVLYINKHLDRELSLRRRKKLEEHLKTCESCRYEFSSLKATVDFVTEVKLTKEASFLSKYALLLKPEQTRKSGIQIKWIAVGAVAILVMAVIGININYNKIKASPTDRGLIYLQKTQNEDGSWGSSYSKKSVAISSLAILGFLEEDSNISSKYSKEISKGISFLVKSAQPTGLIADSSEGSIAMYSHAYAILALSKYYQITKKDEIKTYLEKAVALAEICQNGRGGWRYRPVSSSQYDDDILVSSSVMLALIKAKEVGISCENDVLVKGVEYIKSCACIDGGLKYFPENPQCLSNFVKTSSGVAVLLASNKIDDKETLNGIAYLNKISMEDQLKDQFYYYGLSFYAHHFEYSNNKNMLAVRGKISKFLIAKQNKDGSWSDRIGDIYATAIATYVLQKNKRAA